jgi:sugar O-acyltransferase (sialic acid O-acetyltransferase NeuD family)
MSVRNIAIVGYGIIGQQIEHFVKEAHKGGSIEFYYFDDVLSARGNERTYPLLEYEDSRFRNFEFYIGLGYKHLCLRNEITESLIRINRRFPSIVHQTAYLHPSVSIGYGSVIYPMCNIGFSVKIGNGTIINKSCTISHDVELGHGSFISPSVTFCGGAKLGDSSFLGAGSVVANEVKIGNRVLVGIGSVITGDISDDLSVIGNPARVVSKLKIK